jgi:hypothetical protein
VKRTDNFTELQKEFKLFEAWKHKNKIFEKKSRQRTSSKQTFSVAGGFSAKLRNSLQYKLLNALVFLRYYFLAAKEIK